MITETAKTDLGLCFTTFKLAALKMEQAEALWNKIAEKYPTREAILENLEQAKTEVQEIIALISSARVPQQGGPELVGAVQGGFHQLTQLLGFIDWDIAEQKKQRHAEAVAQKEREAQKAAQEAQERAEYQRFQELQKKYGNQSETLAAA